jgi:DnaJ-domain-containing protein 1
VPVVDYTSADSSENDYDTSAFQTPPGGGPLKALEKELQNSSKRDYYKQYRSCMTPVQKDKVRAQGRERMKKLREREKEKKQAEQEGKKINRSQENMP